MSAFDTALAAGRRRGTGPWAYGLPEESDEESEDDFSDDSAVASSEEEGSADEDGDTIELNAGLGRSVSRVAKGAAGHQAGGLDRRVGKALRGYGKAMK